MFELIKKVIRKLMAATCLKNVGTKATKDWKLLLQQPSQWLWIDEGSGPKHRT